MIVGRRGLVRTFLFTVASLPGSLRGARTPLHLGRGLAEAAQTGALSSAEMDDLLAFAEIVVEGRPLGRSEREALVAEIEARITLEDDARSLYRTTVTVLRRLAGRRFATLDFRARSALVSRHRLDSRHVAPDDDLGPLGDEIRAVRTRVLGSVIGDYYRSAAGWAVVGYATFPGRCGDLTRYTRAER